MSWNGPPPPPPPPHAQMPFWDFMQHLDPNRAGAGVDHTAGFPTGFPFGEGGPFQAWGGRGRSGWGWGWGGGPGGWGRHRHGRHGRRRGQASDEEGEEVLFNAYTDGEEQTAGEEDVRMTTDNEKQQQGEKDGGSPATMRDAPAAAADGEHPDPPESVPVPPFGGHHHHRHHHGPGFRGRGGRCGRGGGGGPGFRGPHGPHRHHHHGPPPPPPYGAGFPLSFGPMMHAFAQSPLAHNLRDYLNRAAGAAGDNNNDDVESFTPPVDVFRTAGGWVLHIAVPGAKKDDIGVNWDTDKAVLSVSGVVHRPGDEVFLEGLVSGERRVGLFRRDVKLPPPGAEVANNGRERDEVDVDNISARMEDGILVVVVPMVEREWTEVRKVDIE